MKVQIISKIFVLSLLLTICSMFSTAYAHSKIDLKENHTYSMDYVVLQGQTESASIANDYFEKPAKVFVKEDKTFVQLKLNHSGWIKKLEFQTKKSFSAVDIVDENEEKDERTVEFEVDNDFLAPIEFKMHVVIEDMEPRYDHRYTVRLDFDESSLEEIDAPYIEKSDSTNKMKEPYIWILGVAIVLIVFSTFLIWLKNKKKQT